MEFTCVVGKIEVYACKGCGATLSLPIAEPKRRS